ncbi:MAG: hypothetical protein OIF57_04645 [Marinobacterium sp.]|nr:hypothetical protein [Marinobacterium sp.]
MDFTVTYYPQFSKEFANFDTPTQDKILDFTDVFEAYGLSDFSRYEGKITHSWKGLAKNHPDAIRARKYDLWHYHIGIPEYVKRHGRYQTSDYLLHFRWPGRGNVIHLVDMNYHYDSSGKFYLPSDKYLTTSCDLLKV